MRLSLIKSSQFPITFSKVKYVSNTVVKLCRKGRCCSFALEASQVVCTGGNGFKMCTEKGFNQTDHLYLVNPRFQLLFKQLWTRKLVFKLHLNSRLALQPVLSNREEKCVQLNSIQSHSQSLLFTFINIKINHLPKNVPRTHYLSLFLFWP